MKVPFAIVRPTMHFIFSCWASRQGKVKELNPVCVCDIRLFVYSDALSKDN